MTKISQYFVIIGLLAGTASFALNLDAAFDAALKRSETIGNSTELIVQAEEKYAQAIGAVLPTITGYASYLIQDTPATTNTAIFPNTQPLVKLTATQPVFRGFREFAALRYNSRLEDSAREQKRQAIHNLYVDVASNYYTILSIETDIENIQTQIGFVDKRIRELDDRVKIGRSRLTEVLTTKSSKGTLEYQLQQLRGQLDAGREAFKFLTGLGADQKLDKVSLVATKLEPIQTYLDQIANRPDVKSAQAQLAASQEKTSIARGAHWPSIDVTGNYYLQRYGATQDVKWDAGVVLTLPIFNGGIISSQVSEAASQEQQNELSVTKAKRAAEQEINTLYKTLSSDLMALDQLQKTRDISELNFKEETKEYRLGLVTNLDVLGALTTFQENERTLDKARFLTEIDMAKLQAATGKSAALERRK